MIAAVMTQAEKAIADFEALLLAAAPGTGTGHQPPLTTDTGAPAVTAQKDPEAARNDRARAARLITDAVRIAQSISD